VVPAFGQGQPDGQNDHGVSDNRSIYFDMGSGPVVVLLHGLGSRKEIGYRCWSRWRRNTGWLVPDQIGFGKSDKPLLDYSVQTYVDFLNEFLRQLKVERRAWWGESLGGWIAALIRGGRLGAART